MTTKRIPFAIPRIGVVVLALLPNTSAGAPFTRIALMSVGPLELLLFALALAAVLLFTAYTIIARRQAHVTSGGRPSQSTAPTSPAALEEELATTIINKLATFDADKKYLDNADMKQLFNISDKTLYRWRKNGTVPFTNLGGKHIYPKQAVLAILQQRLDNKYDPIHIKPHQKAN